MTNSTVTHDKPKVKVLATGPIFHPQLLRVSVDGKAIKYIYPASDVFLVSQVAGDYHEPELPPFPAGSWKVGQVSRSELTGETFINPLTDKTDDGITGLCGPQIDYCGLTKLKSIDDDAEGRTLQDRLSVVSHPTLFAGPAVMKLVEYPQALVGNTKAAKLMRNEIVAHQRAARFGLAPRFIGLVTENDRGVIGYLSEFIEDGKTFDDIGQRVADEDVKAFMALVDRLHGDAELIHGDLHWGNILRRPDGSILLIDFEFAATLQNRSASVVSGMRQAELDRFEAWAGLVRQR
jgi:hypothetical protein